MLRPRLALNLIRPYNNNPAESWNHKIKCRTNNKFCNPIHLHTALIDILQFQYTEMGRALSGLGELIAPDVLCFQDLLKMNVEDEGNYRDSLYRTLLHFDFHFDVHKFQYEYLRSNYVEKQYSGETF